MTEEPDVRSALMDQLDKTEQIATTVGLVASGMICAAGIAGLLFVLIKVASTSPVSFGSQGEWLYGAVACLLVAGWGFGRAASLYARRRGTSASIGQEITPEIHVGPEGFSIKLTSPRDPGPESQKPGSWTWSFNSMPAQVKTLKLSEAQLAAAEEEAKSMADWDVVCRKAIPEYAAFSAFEQNVYRQAVQAAIEGRQGKQGKRV